MYSTVHTYGQIFSVRITVDQCFKKISGIVSEFVMRFQLVSICHADVVKHLSVPHVYGQLHTSQSRAPASSLIGRNRKGVMVCPRTPFALSVRLSVFSYWHTRTIELGYCLVACFCEHCNESDYVIQNENIRFTRMTLNQGF